MHLSSCGMDWRNTGESTTTIISGCYCIFEGTSCLFQPPETELISLSVSFNMVSIILRHYDGLCVSHDLLPNRPTKETFGNWSLRCLMDLALKLPDSICGKGCSNITN